MERKMRLTPRHIPFARLADLAEGRLSPEEAAEERAHLDGCTSCVNGDSISGLTPPRKPTPDSMPSTLTRAPPSMRRLTIT